MEQGQRLKPPEELVNVWDDFLEKTNEDTDLDQTRKDFQALPLCVDEKDEITHTEFEHAVNKMKKNKSTVSSWVKYGKNKQEVSIELAVTVTVFIMIFKNKGYPEDYSKYRCIRLLCHAYKIMTIILL